MKMVPRFEGKIRAGIERLVAQHAGLRAHEFSHPAVMAGLASSEFTIEATERAVQILLQSGDGVAAAKALGLGPWVLLLKSIALDANFAGQPLSTAFANEMEAVLKAFKLSNRSQSNLMAMVRVANTYGDEIFALWLVQQFVTSGYVLQAEQIALLAAYAVISRSPGIAARKLTLKAWTPSASMAETATHAAALSGWLVHETVVGEDGFAEPVRDGGTYHDMRIELMQRTEDFILATAVLKSCAYF